MVKTDLIGKIAVFSYNENRCSGKVLKIESGAVDVCYIEAINGSKFTSPKNKLLDVVIVDASNIICTETISNI